jgi:hypothetical protein
MTKTIAVALLFATVLPAIPALAGPCDHSSDRASDGSRCGGRSSDSRPGGK